jgi:hypothetical protein
MEKNILKLLAIVLVFSAWSCKPKFDAELHKKLAEEQTSI